MPRSKSKLLLGASAIAFAASGAFAQSGDETNNDAQAADTTDGQVIVEQKDATVNVEVPDPDVEVMQGQPVVTVEQPQPEITVVVPEPNVRVEQQAPVITVEQAQPEITVRIPEPVVTIMVPKPEVDVETGDAMVDVQQPEPVIRFVRPEPKITLEQSEPNIQVSQSEADVNVSAADNPDVTVSQEEPQVNIEQGDGANVEVTETEPEVNVVASEEADVNVSQAEARVVLEDFNADETGKMQEEDLVSYSETVSELPIFNLRVDELVGRTVATEQGEDVGEVDNIGLRGDTVVAIIGVGGFLGMGESNVAIPVNKLLPRENAIIVPAVTESQLKEMPEYSDQEVEILDSGIRLNDAVRTD